MDKRQIEVFSHQGGLNCSILSANCIIIKSYLFIMNDYLEYFLDALV